MSNKTRSLIIFVLGFLIYCNVLFAPFLFDDERTVTKNPITQNLDQSIRSFFPNNTRYLSQLSFALNFKVSKFNTFPYHLTNVSIHMLATIVVWQLILLILETPALKKKSFTKYKDQVAFYSALIFLTHPIQTQAVAYISQRSTEMSALFYLLSLLFFVKFRSNRSENNKQNSYINLTLCVASGLAAFYSKASAFSLPIALLATEFFFFTKAANRLKFILVSGFLFLVLVAFGYLIMDKNEVNRIKISPLGEKITTYNYALTQTRVIPKYIQLLVFPIKQTADYYFPISTSPTDLKVISGSVLLILMITLMILLFKKHRLISFGILFFFIALSIESSIVAIDDVIFEHRLYLPMFGFVLLLSITLYKIAEKIKKPQLYYSLTLLLIFIYSLLTFNRNFVWTDEIKFWSDVVKKAPLKAKGHGALGVAYDKVEKLDEAVAAYEKSLELNPDLADLYLKLHNNLGFTKFKQGKNDEAIEHYQKVLDVAPNFFQTLVNLAQLYMQENDADKVIKYLEQAEAIEPNVHFVEHNLGISYLQIGNTQKAEEHLMRAYKLDPNNLQTKKAIYKLDNKIN